MYHLTPSISFSLTTFSLHISSFFPPSSLSLFSTLQTLTLKWQCVMKDHFMIPMMARVFMAMSSFFMAFDYFSVNICTVHDWQKSCSHMTLIILIDFIIAAHFAPSTTGLRKRRLTRLLIPFSTMFKMHMLYGARAQTVSCMTLILPAKHTYYFWNQSMYFFGIFGEKWSRLVSKRQKLFLC